MKLLMFATLFSLFTVTDLNSDVTVPINITPSPPYKCPVCIGWHGLGRQVVPSLKSADTAL